jgi:hypothetical protein
VGCGPTRAQDLINTVNAANTAGGGSIVPAGALCTYTFTGPDAPTNHLNALPVITTPITITGALVPPSPRRMQSGSSKSAPRGTCH